MTNRGETADVARQGSAPARRLHRTLAPREFVTEDEAMLLLSRRQVESLLDIDRLIDRLAEAMADLSSGRASVPPRVAAMVGERSLLAAMPAYLPSARILESKLVSLFPGNAGAGIPTHQAVIVTFDPATGTPTALMDGAAITEWRTAGGSALATRLLARDEARVLAVIGTGVQARAHAQAVARVRRVERIVVAGRDQAKAKALADRLGVELGVELGLPVAAARSPEEAIQEADIVCACTHSSEPVVRRAWLRPGTHVTSIGYNVAGREVDAATVADAVVVVESRQSALAPPPAGSNDITWPIRDGLIGEDHVHAEVGELVLGTKSGRTSPDQITLYKSVGVGVQDAAAAALVLEAALARGTGVEVEL